MSSPLCGPWHSSTRAEAGALIIAAQIDRPIHIGIDNKAVVDRSNQMIARAKEEESKGRNTARIKKAKTADFFGGSHGVGGDQVHEEVHENGDSDVDQETLAICQH